MINADCNIKTNVAYLNVVLLYSQQEMGTRISSPSATCHSYEEVDYHALECRNFNGNASLPVNNALSVKTYASFESRDSKKTKDCTF